MKKLKKIFKNTLVMALCIFLLDTQASEPPALCNQKLLNEFKGLYIELQRSLNYEKQDAELINGKVQLKPHPKDVSYGGKDFEKALFVEYQNALIKVGKVYQEIKAEGIGSLKSNESLVNFIQAIDDKKSTSEQLANKYNVTKFLNAIQSASKFKFAKNKEFIISDSDKYLLEKLITHAQDRLANLNAFKKTNKRTRLFDAEYLKSVQNAPLNRLLSTLKNATITKDSKINLQKNPHPALISDLVTPGETIESAVAENMNNLRNWMNRNMGCLPNIKTKDFQNSIQSHIQNCNYNYFIEAISKPNVDNIEAVLHFINANEKFMSNPTPLAETALDESLLDEHITKAFNEIGNKFHCQQIKSSQTGEQSTLLQSPLFEKLLKTKGSSISIPGLSCQVNSRPESSEYCNKNVQMTPDPLKRGFLATPIITTPSNMTITIANDDSSCSNISLSPSTTEEKNNNTKPNENIAIKHAQIKTHILKTKEKKCENENADNCADQLITTDDPTAKEEEIAPKPISDQLSIEEKPLKVSNKEEARDLSWINRIPNAPPIYNPALPLHLVPQAQKTVPVIEQPNPNQKPVKTEQEKCDSDKTHKILQNGICVDQTVKQAFIINEIPLDPNSKTSEVINSDVVKPSPPNEAIADANKLKLSDSSDKNPLLKNPPVQFGPSDNNSMEKITPDVKPIEETPKVQETVTPTEEIPVEEKALNAAEEKAKECEEAKNKWSEQKMLPEDPNDDIQDSTWNDETCSPDKKKKSKKDSDLDSDEYDRFPAAKTFDPSYMFNPQAPYYNKQPPPRFIPIPIPGRKPSISPGML